MISGIPCKGPNCGVDFIIQWSIVDSHLSYTRALCPVNKIHNFCHCKSKLSVFNWSSRLHWTWLEVWPYLTDVCRAWKPILAHYPGYHYPDLCRWVCLKSINKVERRLALEYHYCTTASNLCKGIMYNDSDEKNCQHDSFTTEILAHGVLRFRWAGSIVAISSLYQLWMLVRFTAFVVKRFTHITYSIAMCFTCYMTITKTPEWIV
jgi:hypothetical protein